MQKITNGVWLFFLGLAFGFRGEAMVSIEAIHYSNISFCLAGVFALASLVIWQSKRIWCGRDNWYATSSYPYELPPDNPQRAINRDRREQWRSADPQEKDAWFEIDMGKPREIASIEFLADDSGIEKPVRWRMMFYGKEHRTLGHKDGDGFVYVAANDIPRKIQYFSVKIKEPATDMPINSNYAKRNLTTKVRWTISLVRMKEYRFSIFGKRFCEHEL